MSATLLLFLELAVVLAMIFIGARVGSVALGMYGMLGVTLLVFVFGEAPGNVPIDVMLIIVALITAASALQAAGGLDYMVEVAARFLRRHPRHITFYGPLTTWLLCILAGTAHSCYALLPIISEIAYKAGIRPERPLSVATISASLGITGSPVSAATAAILSRQLLGAQGISMREILLVTIPASLVSILVASFVQNLVGKPLEEDPEYRRRVKEGILEEPVHQAQKAVSPRARWSVWVFLLGVLLVVLFGSFPALRPSIDGTPVSMNATIEMVMMSVAALILLAGKADVRKAVSGNVFRAGMVAMVAIFGVAWMGSTFFEANKALILGSMGDIFTHHPLLFAIPLFLMSIMLFSQAATIQTLYPVGLALGISPLLLLAIFPAVNGYFFLPNYPTEVAAIGFDRTGTTRIGRFVINHSFQLAGFITTVVSIALSCLIIQFIKI